MQQKLKLPGNHLDWQQDLWDRFDQNAQLELLQVLSRVLGKAVENNEAHQTEDHEATAHD